jgi:hypothetical protein
LNHASFSDGSATVAALNWAIASSRLFCLKSALPNPLSAGAQSGVALSASLYAATASSNFPSVNAFSPRSNAAFACGDGVAAAAAV